MALLGALVAAGGGRRGCVLRVAADAITFYCGGGDGDTSTGVPGGSGGTGNGGGALDAGGADDDSDGPADCYLRTLAATAADYVRPVRSAAIGGGYSIDVNGTADATASATAGTVMANLTAGIDPFLNGSYNRTDVEGAENLTNYIFVISIGIILGAMILTTICGKCAYPNNTLIH